MVTNQGKCEKCNQPNLYTDVACVVCGARLPWAGAVNKTATPTAFATPGTIPDPVGFSQLSIVGKVSFIGIAVIFGLFMLIYLMGSPPVSSPSGSLLGGATIVRMSHYSQIPTNATYEQVVTIIGDPGKQMQHQQMMGYTDVTYIWQNSNGSNLICHFQNGRLTNKTQTLLPD